MPPLPNGCGAPSPLTGETAHLTGRNRPRCPTGRAAGLAGRDGRPMAAASRIAESTADPDRPKWALRQSPGSADERRRRSVRRRKGGRFSEPFAIRANQASMRARVAASRAGVVDDCAAVVRRLGEGRGDGERAGCQPVRGHRRSFVAAQRRVSGDVEGRATLGRRRCQRLARGRGRLLQPALRRKKDQLAPGFRLRNPLRPHQGDRGELLRQPLFRRRLQHGQDLAAVRGRLSLRDPLRQRRDQPGRLLP